MDGGSVILTPEKVVVSVRMAGIGARAGAQLIDLCAIAFLFTAFSMVANPIVTAVFGGVAASGLLALALFALVFLYFGILEAFWQGQTLGKKATRLRVMMADGTPVLAYAAFYRNLLRPADFAPFGYLLGTVAVFLNARSQRLGDLVAGTVVVREPAALTAFSPAPHRAGVHWCEPGLPDLRTMSLEEYVALKRLADRFPQLPDEARHASIQEVWKPFAERQGIRPDPRVHPIYQLEAVVMKYGRMHNLV
ncbi:MAG: RDD family protein [Fimbriimonadaceae bacterium]|nr:RDD family protein [Fimbriimonadaceae bacterium]QYK57969.1 MAG: RDD family protein [Fimbriimonadaceae bacterium]